ncbi:ComEC/Rec2 family competence protein [Patescibacteria group bacterium]
MPNRLYKILLILGITACFLVIPVFWTQYEAKTELEVDFLDVGQGDSILIKTPFGQNVLIDGGEDNSVIRELSKNLPWFDRTIDLMILSHPHGDHVDGLNEVIKRYQVKKILYTGVVYSTPGYIAWLELIRDNKIPLSIIDRPQKITLGQECYLDIMYPLKNLLGQEVNNLNNSSIVVKLVYKDIKYLFVGDAETEVEKELLNIQADLSAQVLKVGHHGSDTSSSEEFLEAVNSKIAVISVGKDNSFGHPSRRIIKRLERLGVQIFRTDELGTIKIASNGENIEIVDKNQ